VAEWLGWALQSSYCRIRTMPLKPQRNLEVFMFQLHKRRDYPENAKQYYLLHLDTKQLSRVMLPLIL
jgi:hypothetical protein